MVEQGRAVAETPLPTDLDVESDKSLLYKPLELTSSMRRQQQVVLLQDAIYRLKEDFNARFQDTLEAKQQEKNKIAGLNEKIIKVSAELEVKPRLYQPHTPVLETPERLLEVGLPMAGRNGMAIKDWLGHRSTTMKFLLRGS
jgi:hypothetical protein